MKNALFCLALCLLCSCREQAPVAEPPAPDPSSVSQETSAPRPGTEVPMFVWVNDLNVREQPRTSSPSIAKVRQEAPVTYLGEQSDFTEKIALRGVTYDEPWLKIRTEDGKVGWAFGGALRNVGEEKGTPLPQKGVINVPHFGRYDLGVWQLEKEDRSEEGDTESITRLFSLGTQLLQVVERNTGEYGYGHTYKVYDADGELIKVRHLEWETLNDNLLTEEVYNLTTNRGYTRQENYTVHYATLQEKPNTVDAEFAEVQLTAAEQEEIRGRFR